MIRNTPSLRDSALLSNLQGPDDHVCEVTSDMRKTLCEGVFFGLLENINLVHHNFGINCKLSGAVFSVSEIASAVPLIHGPTGCAFHQRLTPWRMFASVCNAESTNLSENDVIYGGERKLREGIMRAYRTYNPSLIVVLPTCVSGLIGDDISGICQDIRSAIRCNIVYVNSEGFAHRGRVMDDNRTNAISSSWAAYQSSATLEHEINGCGQEEVARALVDQLMEEQDVLDDKVNIELNGKCRISFKRRLGEMKRILENIGLGINATLLAGTVDEIKHAPAASINIVTHNRMAAERMKERFGTKIFRKSPNHNGIDGIEKFYIDIASNFGLAGEAESVLKREKEFASDMLKKQKRVFENYNFAIFSQDWLLNPHMARALVDDFGIHLRYFCINTNQLRRMRAISHDNLDSLQSDLAQLFSEWDLDTQIIVNPTHKEIMDAVRNVDCMISNGPMAILHGHEVVSKMIDISSMNYLLLQTSFKGVVEFGQLLALYIKQMPVSKQNNSIISYFNCDPIHYPLISDSSSYASRNIWYSWKSGKYLKVD